MFKKFNAHPKKKRVGDCVKRAICTAEERDYRQVTNELNALKRSIGAEKFDNPVVWKNYIKEKEYEKLSFPAEKGKKRMNRQRFMKQFKKGNYILRMAGHLSCCVNGDILDTYDCTGKCVYTAWKVK